VPHSKAQTLDLPEKLADITVVNDISYFAFFVTGGLGNKLEHFTYKFFN
jgi:hypothetical protein